MANSKIEKAAKYRKIKAPNGYIFNINNYIYNPSHGNEYPSFIKVIADTDEKTTYKKVYFFRYYDRSAGIYVTTYSRLKNGEMWQVINRNPDYSGKIVERLPAGTRFNVKLLFKYCD